MSYFIRFGTPKDDCASTFVTPIAKMEKKTATINDWKDFIRFEKIRFMVTLKSRDYCMGAENVLELVEKAHGKFAAELFLVAAVVGVPLVAYSHGHQCLHISEIQADVLLEKV